MDPQKHGWYSRDEDPESGVCGLMQSASYNSKKSRSRSENMHSCRKQLLPLFNTSVESTATQTEVTSSHVNFNNALQIKHLSDEWMAVSFPKFVYDMPPTVGPNYQERVLTFLLVDPGDPTSHDIFEPTPFSENGTLIKFPKTTVLVRKNHLKKDPGPTKSEVKFNQLITGFVNTCSKEQAKSVPNIVADELEADSSDSTIDLSEPTPLNEDEASIKFSKKIFVRNDHLKNDAGSDKTEDYYNRWMTRLANTCFNEQGKSVPNIVANEPEVDSTSDDLSETAPFDDDGASITFLKTTIRVENDHLIDTDPDKFEIDSGGSTSKDFYDPTPLNEDEASSKLPKRILGRNYHLKNDVDPDKPEIDSGGSTSEDLYDPTPLNEDEASIKFPKKILGRNDYLKNDAGPFKSEVNFDMLMSALVKTCLTEQVKSVPNIVANEPGPSTSLMYGKRIRAVGPVVGQAELFNAENPDGNKEVISLGSNSRRYSHEYKMPSGRHYPQQRSRGIGRSIGNNVFRRDHPSCSQPRMMPPAYQPSQESRYRWSSMQRSVRPATHQYYGPVRNQRPYGYRQPRRYFKPSLPELVESPPRDSNSGNKGNPI